MTTNGSSKPFKAVMIWFSLWVLITLAIASALLESIALSPIVRIETSQFPAVQSQLFYKSKGEYNERNSQISKLNTSDHTFSFTLTKYDDNVRWDPLESSGSFYLMSATINILGHSEHLALENFTPLSQIAIANTDKKSIKFATQESATDPQINIHIDSKKLDKTRLILAIAIAALITTVIFAWVKWHRRTLEILQSENTYTTALRRIVKTENFTLAEFANFLAFSITLNIIPIVSFFLSPDDEIGAFRTDPSVWIADGRWTAFLIEKFIFPQPVMPFLPNFFFYICLALSYMLLLRAFRLKLNWMTYLAYGVLAAHPIWWFIAEFYSNIPSTGIGVLTLSTGIFIFSKCEPETDSKGELGIKIAACGFLLALAIGAYQSLATFYISAGLGVCIFKYRTDNFGNRFVYRPTLYRAIFLLGTVICGTVIYVIINKTAHLYHLSTGSYIDSFLRIQELLDNPLSIINLTMMEAFKLYSGSSTSYGTAFFSSGIVLSLAIILLATQKNWKATSGMTMLITAMLIAPFLLNFVTGAVYLPLRAMLAVSFIIWIAAIIMMEREGLLRIISTICVLIMLFQMLSVNAQYSASTILATNHDRLTAEAIYARIAKVHPSFDRNARVEIDVFGKLSLHNRYPSPPSSTMSASFFDWDNGNASRMVRYMQLIGFTSIHTVQYQQRIELTPEFESMPIWPADGSVRFKNGVVLIKLGDAVDPTHALYRENTTHE